MFKRNTMRIWFIVTALFVEIKSDFVLNILHTNDVHSRIEELNKYGGVCTPADRNASTCFGGVARRHTAVEKVRATEQNVILLDGGDQYQGTTWFGVYKGTAAVTFMNYTKYDAMTLGNHEFDNGPQGIIPFINQARFPIVSSNMDVSKEPNWPSAPNFKKSTILTVDGTKVGVIGYITPDTKWLSQPGPNIKFTDVISSVRAEAKRLKNEGVKILIALGHAGFKTDKLVASSVEELDVIVGGHTNTFLYTGKKPSNENPEGPYPVVLEHAGGTKALVVQDFTYGKYLGHLKVTFTNDGKVKKWSGNPILLNSSYVEDPKVLAMVKQMDDPILVSRNSSIGYSYVHLEGGKPDCRVRDCNLGNLVADAIVKMNQQTPDSESWATVVLGIWNGGGLRASISKARHDPITLEDITSVMPFGNTADIANISGKVLRETFEHSVSGVDENKGRYLQVSGFYVRYDETKPVGSRIVTLKALCLKCTTRMPEYEDVKENQYYKVLAPSYILQGGDGFSMLKNVPRHQGESASDLVRRYVPRESPITITAEDRSVAVKGCVQQTTVKPTTTPKSASSMLNYSIITLSTIVLSKFLL